MSWGRIWWGVYTAVAAADVAASATPNPLAVRARRVTKPALMPVLAVALRSTVGGAPNREQRLALAGIGLSWLGDAFLLGESDPHFVRGLSAFLAAHIAYAAGFENAGAEGPAAGGPQPSRPVRRWPVELATLTLVPALTAAAWRRTPRLAGPVAAYGMAISAMALSAARRAARRPGPDADRIRVGARLFILSDLLIGISMFFRPPLGRWTDPVIMATYTAGQGLIAAGVAARGPVTTLDQARTPRT